MRFSFPCGQMALPPLSLHRPSASRAGRWHCQSNTAVFALALLPLGPCSHFARSRRFPSLAEGASLVEGAPLVEGAMLAGATEPDESASGHPSGDVRSRVTVAFRLGFRLCGPTHSAQRKQASFWTDGVLHTNEWPNLGCFGSRGQKIRSLDSCLAEGEGERAASLVALGVGAAATSSLVSLGGFGETVRSTAVTAAGQDHGTCSTST